jgi:8-oxo-dGTP pyrophosphatase MutT (NUDIX family)
LEFREEIQTLNPWVNLVTRFTIESSEPYLHLRTQDYVAIIAVYENKITLVKQFRIALNIETIELPSGLIDQSQTPISAALRELEEEAGLIPTSEAIALPVHYIDSARLETRVSPFFFQSTKKKEGWVAEAGITPLWMEKEDLTQALASGMLSLSSHSGMLAYLRMSGEI